MKEGMGIFKNYLRTLAGLNVNIRLLLMRTVIMGLYAGIYGIIFNLYILDMGFRTDFLGLLLSVSLLTSSAMSIPAGVLCDRFDRRKLMLVSSALSVAMVLPIFILHSPSALVLFSALYGVFSSISAVCLTPVLAENCGGETVHVFSANASLGWIASVAGCAFGGLLPGIWSHYCAAFNSYRLTLLCALALLALSVSPTRALVLSQVVLSFGIPFALVPLVRLTSDRRVMGEHVNGPLVTGAAWAIAGVIISLNAYLLGAQFLGV
jgi:MFS family permease